MRIKQVSVFVENEAGRLESILEALQREEINIHALSVSDTAEFGIVRMVLDNPDKGLDALRQSGFTTRVDWMLSAYIPDVPGGLLSSVAKPMAEAGINIKYFYAYIGQAGENRALVVLKPDDLEKAEEVLAAR